MIFEGEVVWGEEVGVGNPRCALCGAKMRRNGSTSSGRQRWRCAACGTSAVRKIDVRAKDLGRFLRWLFPKDSIADKAIGRATFWRRTSWIWSLRPIAPYTGEVSDAVFPDGIWLKRDAVVLIACDKGHVLAWHLAQSECSEAWAALMMRMPAPSMLVSDGARGLARAASAIWPATRIQRCTFHAASQVKRCTTLNPKLECGRGPLGIANRLKGAKDASAAAKWLVEYNDWCTKWERFLREFTLRDGKRLYTHERLRKARRSLNKLVQSGQLFTFVEMAEEHGGTWASTNNVIESRNARIREMLRLHRGLPLMHRIKAVFWWCYMHTESPLPLSEILRVMPTDDQVEGLFASASDRHERDEGAPEEYGSGIVWSEFHMPTEYR